VADRERVGHIPGWDVVIAVRHLRQDDGYSLSELIVVLGLIGLVLSGAYALYNLASAGAAQSSRESWISREIGQPLENVERILMQQSPPLVAAGPYSCTVKTDQDRDNHYEYHTFEATADGRFVQTYREDVDRPTPQVQVWSDHNANNVGGSPVPVFVYYDNDGNDLSGEEELYVKVYASSVEVTLVTDHDGAIYSDMRRLYFRNRR